MKQSSSATRGFIPEPLAQFPWKVILLLIAIGVFDALVLYSAANGHVQPWALKQGVLFSVFLAAAMVMSRVGEDFWGMISLPSYALLCVALIGVELLGKVAGGSQRWLDLGFIRLQPSELMKPFIVLALARFYDLLPASETRKFVAIWPALVLIGLPAALVMLQPDLGTAMMITLGGIVVVFLAGIPLRLFLGGGLAAAIAAPLAFNFVLHDYQRNRILIFLNPESDPLGTGYHITQSKIAIGSGGIWGKGFLNGSQSHLDYLPEGQTDFALATMMEEWGLVGGVLLIMAWFAIIWWAMGVALRAQGRFARLAAAGLATTLFFYVSINMAMVMGLAPVVGVPLPLISYGGSSQMTVMLCIGILMSIDRSSRKQSRW
ncbi:rod shape-determining protein RodA [Sphingomonas panacisoli]|uniref:Peptidoglycan glycosyltransferase MrdB n=1 Tax=Sphingomonas panacisoli TaxID=1813879 RepID=A0A5B8LHV5_9SPHN|nr:rod shape-determining protein RodA [Sphingomonas panacisoli]QDZ07631.1 rod shape-determining protein RodA [Sphingomonas panacisoli]